MIPNDSQFPQESKNIVISPAMRRALAARGMESADEQLTYMQSVNDRFKNTSFRSGKE